MSGTKQTILLVEDDKSLATLIQLGLQAHGYEVEIIADGLNAREHLKQKQPSLVLLDLFIPGIDGVQLLSWIRGEAGFTFPVVVLSAADTEEATVMAQGATAFMVKPVELDEVVRAVAETLKETA